MKSLMMAVAVVAMTHAHESYAQRLYVTKDESRSTDALYSERLKNRVTFGQTSDGRAMTSYGFDREKNTARQAHHRISYQLYVAVPTSCSGGDLSLEEDGHTNALPRFPGEDIGKLTKVLQKLASQAKSVGTDQQFAAIKGLCAEAEKACSQMDSEWLPAGERKAQDTGTAKEPRFYDLCRDFRSAQLDVTRDTQKDKEHLKELAKTASSLLTRLEHTREWEYRPPGYGHGATVTLLVGDRAVSSAMYPRSVSESKPIP